MHKILVKVGYNTPYTVIVECHTGTTSLFKYIKYSFALAHCIEQHRCSTKVHAERTYEKQMRTNTHKLVHNYAYNLSTLRNLHAQSLFNTQAQAMTVLMSRQIVKTVGKVQSLRIAQRF